MADFFKKISKGLAETSKNVKDSVADSREKSNLRKQIAAANDKITQLKTAIGDKIYEAYCKNEQAEDCVEMCRDIDGLYADIEKYNVDLLAIDGIKKCTECGSQINVEASFCSHCGAKQEVAVETVESQSDETDDSSSDDSSDDIYVNVGK